MEDNSVSMRQEHKRKRNAVAAKLTGKGRGHDNRVGDEEHAAARTLSLSVSVWFHSFPLCLLLRLLEPFGSSAALSACAWATHNAPDTNVLLVSGLVLALELRHLVDGVEETVFKKTERERENVSMLSFTDAYRCCRRCRQVSLLSSSSSSSSASSPDDRAVFRSRSRRPAAAIGNDRLPQSHGN